MTCEICKGPMPKEATKRAKYCSQKCRNKSFNSRLKYEEKLKRADDSIDWFGFLTRKGLASNRTGLSEL